MKKVVCIDDSEIDISIESQVVRRSGFAETVQTFTDARIALNWFKSTDQQVDLVLLDINMPVMNGFQFLEEFSHLKIVGTVEVCFITTSERTEEIERAASLGAKFLVKPLTRKKFQGLVNEIFVS